MRKHTSIYRTFFDLSIADMAECELCGLVSHQMDVHHIECRGLGGNPLGDKDRILNLMGLCRECHEQFGDISKFKDTLRKKHINFMMTHQPKKTEALLNSIYSGNERSN